jgi:hypothetical protein
MPIIVSYKDLTTGVVFEKEKLLLLQKIDSLDDLIKEKEKSIDSIEKEILTIELEKLEIEQVLKSIEEYKQIRNSIKEKIDGIVG